MKKNRPVCFDITTIQGEFSIEIKNRFEAFMAIQKEITPVEIVNRARDILISTAKATLPMKKSKKQIYLSRKIFELIKERRNLIKKWKR